MTDLQVLQMPAKRFWAMESCINRINAANGFRDLSVAQSVQSQDASKMLVERLTLEMGETVKIKRSAYVAPEPGYKEKMRKFLK